MEALLIRYFMDNAMDLNIFYFSSVFSFLFFMSPAMLSAKRMMPATYDPIKSRKTENPAMKYKNPFEFFPIGMFLK